MPKLKDILVQVTVDGLDKNGEKLRRPLEEWGVQKMKNSKKISAYIEAETGKSFRILIQPKIPFPSKDAPAAHEYNTRQKAKAREHGLETTRPGFFKMDEDWHDEDGNHFSPRMDNHTTPIELNQNIAKNISAGNLDRYCKPHSNVGADARRRRSNSDASVKIKEEPTDEPVTFTLPAPSEERMIKRTPPPPFHLLASLYLDGREKPERKVIVYLDPDDDEFHYPSGEVEIKTRWTQCKDGNIKEQSWVFQDIGIETLFDKMLIAGDKTITPVAQRSETELVNAFDTIYLDGDGDIVREEKSKVGQILVTIERVKLGERWQDTNFRAKHKEHETEDIDMTDAGKEITHTTGFAHKKTVSAKSEGVRVVAFTKFKADEGIFAAFQFFYRSKSILQKFDFAGLPKVISRGLPSKRSNLAFKTPLSITSSTSTACAADEKDKRSKFHNDKRNIKAKGLFSGSAFRKMYHENRQSLKKEESDSTWNDQSKVNLLSLSSLVPGGPSFHLAPPASDLDSHDRPRYNLRSRSDTNNLSLKPSVHSIPFGSNGLDTLLCRANSNLLGVTPTVCVTPSSEPENGSPGSTSKAGHRSASAPYSFSNLGSTLRDNGNDTSDADEEREVADIEAHLISDKDHGDCQTCQNKDDQGLSLGVKELVLGKRGRHSEDRDFGEAGTGAKKIALDRSRRTSSSPKVPFLLEKRGNA
ncbi:hypothetical protein MMC18_005455 [Xylographa bjoerkii]|nr:hypothetical protein [Xylographa bjoerkii]